MSARPELAAAFPASQVQECPFASIAIDYKAGMTPEKIAEEFPHLTLAQIYAGLAYYHANKDEVEAEIAAYYEECKYWEAEYMAGKLS